MINLIKTSQEQTFCHELVHWILNVMSEDEKHDEQFVETFSMLLHQALTTMEYAKAVTK